MARDTGGEDLKAVCKLMGVAHLELREASTERWEGWGQREAVAARITGHTQEGGRRPESSGRRRELFSAVPEPDQWTVPGERRQTPRFVLHMVEAFQWGDTGAQCY